MRMTMLAMALASATWADAPRAVAEHGSLGAETDPPALSYIDGPGLRCTIDPQSGSLARMESRVGGRHELWLQEPMRIEVRNEVTGTTAGPSLVGVQRKADGIEVRRRLDTLSLELTEQWNATAAGIKWELAFVGEGKRAGHEVILELPVLSRTREVFTPSERGVVSVAAYPDYQPSAYGAYAWGTGGYYVLPLVSVFDPASDNALTVALPADANIPHLQVDWSDAKILRLHLAHRGMGGPSATSGSPSVRGRPSRAQSRGGGQPSGLKLLFYAHPADYRCVLKAYSDDFPRYFRPGPPRGQYEGAFYYHHIQAHPDFEEMQRQDVRYIWASFWFTYLGEYLPAEPEWAPYTYARWWSLGETMTDERIRAFVGEMHEHGIGAFAYFNTTEYGGAGGEGGDTAAADRALRGRFADALMLDPNGDPIPTWENSFAMNPGPRYAFFPHLQEQLQRHLARLPELDGFTIDRLDWSSRYDYGHRDGFTMVGEREVENMAVPVAEAVQRICRLAHEAGKRVYVNQFYRIDVLRDVDGYCHEYDYPRGLGYLSPFRPAAAWHQPPYPYTDDLLPFEAQLKSRLQVALFPHMIAHQYPISQQAPDPEAADLLEVYAPLFARLRGKEQVLLPHCVSVTGANDVSLFVNDRRQYVAPVTSRVRFLCRGGGPAETVTVSLRVPDGSELSWAHVMSADGPLYRATLSRTGNSVEVTADRHITATVVVVGKGTEPDLQELRPSVAQARQRLVEGQEPETVPLAGKPELSTATAAALLILGTHVGVPGSVSVVVMGRKLGEVSEGVATFPLPFAPRELPRGPLEVRLLCGDEGTWYVVERAQLLVKGARGRDYCVAQWRPACGAEAGSPWGVSIALDWCRPVQIVRATARFLGRDAQSGGDFAGRFGSKAVFIPAVTSSAPRTQTSADEQNGYRLEASRQVYVWADGVDDARVLRSPDRPPQAGRRATCWFDSKSVTLSVTPPDREPYRLTVYLLDFDRNARAMEARVRDLLGLLDTQTVSVQETESGVYLSWIVTGAVTVELAKTAGYNAVASGVFIDPASD